MKNFKAGLFAMPAAPSIHTKLRGFALPSAIFLIVVLALLAAFLVRISTTQHATSSQDVLGTRAYHAARSGIEWAMFQILDPTNVTLTDAALGASGTNAPLSASFPNMRACSTPNPQTLTVEEFQVLVQCTALPNNAGVPGYYNEGANPARPIDGVDRFTRVYVLTATATLAGVAAGDTRYVERQVQTQVALCRSSTGAVPAYTCG